MFQRVRKAMFRNDKTHEHAFVRTHTRMHTHLHANERTHPCAHARTHASTHAHLCHILYFNYFHLSPIFPPRRDGPLTLDTMQIAALDTERYLREWNPRRSDDHIFLIIFLLEYHPLKSLFFKLFVSIKAFITTWWAYWSKVKV